jgi:UrcA family protein
MTASLPRYSGLSIIAAGMMFAAAPVWAQEVAPPPGPGAVSSEEIIVTAPPPNIRVERFGRASSLPPSKVSLTDHIRYSDLDLTTAGGATELRARIRHAARHVCNELRDAYPFQQVAGTDCYKDAARDGLGRVDNIVATARQKPMAH